MLEPLANPLNWPASRYLCIHPSCSALPLPPRQHATWSALQKHSKAAHPPTCPHAACAGKTFTTPRGLKWHLKVHDRTAGDDLPACRKRGRGKGRRKRRVESEEDALETDPGCATESDECDRMDSEREERLDEAQKWQVAKKKRKIDMAAAAEDATILDERDEDASAPFACDADDCSRRFKSVRSHLNLTGQFFLTLLLFQG